MPTIHALIGLPCSGKSTYAKKLEKKVHGIILSIDQWQLSLFGQDLEEKDHDQRRDTIEHQLWTYALNCIRHGLDVILDYGFLLKTERDDYKAKAEALGVHCNFYYLKVAEKTLWDRVKARNQDQEMANCSYVIPEYLLDRFISFFQPPMIQECHEIIEQ